MPRLNQGMNNLSSTTTVERRAHQQRPDPTSFAAWIDHHLSLATDAGIDLYLAFFLRPNMKFHVRITTVAGCFLTGVMLGGFRVKRHGSSSARSPSMPTKSSWSSGSTDAPARAGSSRQIRTQRRRSSFAPTSITRRAIHAVSWRHRLEAETATLIAALSAMNDETAQELADRVHRCREHRIRRRQSPVVTVVDALRAGPQFKCKTVACWCCRTAHVKRKKAQAVAVFAETANADCSFVTVNAAMPCDDVDGIAAAHSKMADDLDNSAMACRGVIAATRACRPLRSWRWGMMECSGTPTGTSCSPIHGSIARR